MKRKIFVIEVLVNEEYVKEVEELFNPAIEHLSKLEQTDDIKKSVESCKMAIKYNKEMINKWQWKEGKDNYKYMLQKLSEYGAKHNYTKVRLVEAMIPADQKYICGNYEFIKVLHEF